MKNLAKNPSMMPRSGIRVLMELAAKIPDVIHLEAGEPNFDTPPHILKAATDAILAGYTKYTPNAGMDFLRKELVNKLHKKNHIEVTMDNIVITSGSVGGLTSAVFALVDAGDEVLLPDPGWPNYVSAACLVGANPKKYSLDPNNNFLPDFSSMEQLITEKTKLLLVNSPSNPTGAVFPKPLIEELLDFVQRHDLYLLTDEVYEDIVFEGEHISPASLDKENRVISVFSFSKSYAMTGWRVGYVVAPLEISDTIKKLQEPLISCIFGVAQKAAEAALIGPQAVTRDMCLSYKKRRDMAIDILQANGILTYIPHGAFYALIDISLTGMDSSLFTNALLQEARVAVAPGETFGQISKDMIRISLATEENKLREGIERICVFIRRKQEEYA